MSRSHKSVPITGIACCDSERRDKQIANRKLRAAIRVALSGGREVMPALREVSNAYSFGKDGKQWNFRRPDLAVRK